MISEGFLLSHGHETGPYSFLWSCAPIIKTDKNVKKGGMVAHIWSNLKKFLKLSDLSISLYKIRINPYSLG